MSINRQHFVATALSQVRAHSGSVLKTIIYIQYGTTPEVRIAPRRDFVPNFGIPHAENPMDFDNSLSETGAVIGRRLFFRFDRFGREWELLEGLPQFVLRIRESRRLLENRKVASTVRTRPPRPPARRPAATTCSPVRQWSCENLRRRTMDAHRMRTVPSRTMAPGSGTADMSPSALKDAPALPARK